jgi:hypothetical protein
VTLLFIGNLKGEGWSFATDLEYKYEVLAVWMKFIYIRRTNCKLKLPSQLTTTSHFARSTSSSKANEKMKKMQAEIDSLKDNPSQVDILKKQVAFFSYCKCKTVGKIR